MISFFSKSREISLAHRTKSLATLNLAQSTPFHRIEWITAKKKLIIVSKRKMYERIERDSEIYKKKKKRKKQ